MKAHFFSLTLRHACSSRPSTSSSALRSVYIYRSKVRFRCSTMTQNPLPFSTSASEEQSAHCQNNWWPHYSTGTTVDSSVRETRKNLQVFQKLLITKLEEGKKEKYILTAFVAFLSLILLSVLAFVMFHSFSPYITSLRIFLLSPRAIPFTAA